MSGNITYLPAEENKAVIAFKKNVDYHTFDIHLPLTFLTGFSGECKVMDLLFENIANRQGSILS